MMKFRKNRRVYLDNAAGTPVSPRVLVRMREAMRLAGPNAGGLHKEAIEARTFLDGARREVARTLDAHADEIMFTSGGTEGNNLAVRGVIRAARKAGITHPHIITTAVEHHSVKEVCEELAEEGVHTSFCPVDETGRVSAAAIRELLTPETVLVSVMYINNETGAIMPIAEIGKMLEKKRAEKKAALFPVFHTDACQAGAVSSLRVPPLHVELMTINGSKLGGPAGSGALFRKRGTPLFGIFTGGGQEFGLRPGTQNFISIAGFAESLTASQEQYEKEYVRLGELKEVLWSGMQKTFPEAVLNGSFKHTAPQILNVSVPGIDNEEMVLRLDAEGIAISTKSACRALEENVSHVIRALGEGHYPENAIRFSLGKQTTKKDIDATLHALERVCDVFKKERALLEQSASSIA